LITKVPIATTAKVMKKVHKTSTFRLKTKCRTFLNEVLLAWSPSMGYLARQ
jgi:hypothetical protein